MTSRVSLLCDHGEDYGFDRLSFVLTETQPNGGPPLHTHTVEEGHVVLSDGHLRNRRPPGDGRVPVHRPRAGRRSAYVHQLRGPASERCSNISQQAARLHPSGAESTCETPVTGPSGLAPSPALHPTAAFIGRTLDRPGLHQTAGCSSRPVCAQLRKLCTLLSRLSIRPFARAINLQAGSGDRARSVRGHR